MILDSALANSPKRSEHFHDDEMICIDHEPQAAPGHIPGFEGFRDAFHDNPLVHEITIRDLTKELDKVTGPVSKEADLALHDILGDEKGKFKVK